MTDHDVEAVLRAVGDRLPVPTGPLPRLAGQLALRRPVADLDHLHLGVRDLDASATFYREWFGLSGEVIDGTLFARNAFGFLLCLTPQPDAEPLSNGHFGFTMPNAAAVRQLHGEMAAAGVAVSDLEEEPGYSSFRVTDPDGSMVEVFAE